MITTEALVETIREANGETARQTERRITETAAELGIQPAADGAWYDDDADEIAMAITR